MNLKGSDLYRWGGGGDVRDNNCPILANLRCVGKKSLTPFCSCKVTMDGNKKYKVFNELDDDEHVVRSSRARTTTLLTHTHSHMHAHTRTPMHTRTHTHMHSHTCTHKYTPFLECEYTCTSLNIFTHSLTHT